MLHQQLAVVREANIAHDGAIKVKRFLMRAKILAAFERLFGCWHSNLSRPFTLSGWTYEVCLSCGKKFAYDRSEVGRRVPSSEISGVERICFTTTAQESRSLCGPGRGESAVWRFR